LTKVTELLQEIKPYVLGWIETGGGEEGGYAPSPHELDGAHHVGTLSSNQYPDALLRDGSRSLLGDLAVAAGIKVDGVDVSAFESSYDAHLSADAHTQYVHISVARIITAQHSFAPTAPGAPFVLGPNAQEVLVTGLNADLWNGQCVDATGSSDDDVLTWDASRELWIPRQPPRPADAEFHIDGALAVETQVAGVWIAPADGFIATVYIHCASTGTSGATIVDVNKNGTTIFTDQGARPTLAAGAYPPVATAMPSVTTITAGDIISVDIDQVGAKASGLSVLVILDLREDVGGGGSGDIVFSIGNTIDTRSLSDSLEESQVTV